MTTYPTPIKREIIEHSLTSFLRKFEKARGIKQNTLNLTDEDWAFAQCRQDLIWIIRKQANEALEHLYEGKAAARAIIHASIYYE